MWYINYRIRLSNAQRRVILALVFAITLSNSGVGIARANELAPTNTVKTDSAGLTVPSYLDESPAIADDVERVHFTTITAYSSRPEETDDSPFITADMSHVRDGIIAANFLKFGTKVRMPELYGDKVFEVHDRMNRRFPDRVDIWMENYPSTIKFGIKHNVKIEIIK